MLGFSPIASAPLGANVDGDKVLVADSGTFTLSMHGAAKLISDVYPSGSYILDGRAVTFKVTRAYDFSLDAGSFAFTGTDAETETRADAGNILLDVNFGLPLDAGTFTLTYSTDLDFQKGFGLIADSGSFASTGNDVTLTKDMNIYPDSGTFTLSGQDFTVTAQLNMAVDAGAFTLTGQDLTLTVQRYFATNIGTFTLTFQEFKIKGFLSPYVPPAVYTEQTVPAEIWTEQTEPTDIWVEQVDASSPTYTEASDTSTNTWTEAA